MSSDTLINVRADTLDVPSSLHREVVTGPKSTQSIKQNFQSVSNSNLSLNYSVSNKAIITNNWELDITGTLYVSCPGNSPGVNPGDTVFTRWGKDMGLAPFSWLWAFTSVTLKLNSVIFTCPLYQLLKPLLRTMSNSELSEFSDMCASLPDQGFFNYSDAVGTNMNVLSGFNDARSGEWVPRGSYPYIAVGGNYDCTDPLATSDGSATVIGGYIKFRQVIPLIMSPLASRGSGLPLIPLSNLQQINIDVTLDGSFSRVIRTPNSSYTVGVGPQGVSNQVFGVGGTQVNLLMMSYYAQDTESIPKQVKCPYQLYDIKTTSISSQLPAGVKVAGTVTPGRIAPVASNVLQYDSYNDYYIFYVQKVQGQQAGYDSDFCFPLADNFAITVNGDNQLLSTLTAEQWYGIVKKYTYQSFMEFVGYANVRVPTQVQNVLPTIGPIYVMKSAIDLNISSSKVKPGMATKVQMQFTNLIPLNYSSTAYNVEFVCIGCKSGEVILTPDGNGTQLTNLVSESQLVSALSAPTVSESEQNDLEGSGKKGGKARRLHRVKHHSAMGRAYGMKHHVKGGNLEMNVSVPNDKNYRF